MCNQIHLQSYRSEGKKLHLWHMPFTVLKAKLTTKASQKEEYKTFKDELLAIMKEQEKFFDKMHMFVCECESMDKAQVNVFLFNILYNRSLASCEGG